MSEGRHSRSRSGPDLGHEAALAAEGLVRVAGVDEAGRGPLAGPVVAAAVVLDMARIPPGIADSKALGPEARARLCAEILRSAEVGLGQASVEEIDRLNILRAAHLAMERAVAALAVPPDAALIDGNLVPGALRCPGRALVRGDARSLSVAAASIVAKVTRDRIMVDLAQQHPGYGWERNMGYPSPAHRAALERLGPTPHHRRSFRPVHKILYQAKSVTL
ncbi:MAG: ribonuclease HII [Rhodobacteraceae bacterium]|nr:ribonuclease HII [Paracoccaceae bacterium]